jgi:hypothetical protein
MASSDPPAGGDREVLASLPNSRPTRRSAKRDRATTKRAGTAASGAAPEAKPGAERGTAKRGAAGKSGAARAAGKSGAARAAAKSGAARPAAKSGATTTGGRRRTAPKAAPIPPAGYATPRTDDHGLRGADLVTTAVQAAGELAHIAIATGGRALKSALQRLPRP